MTAASALDYAALSLLPLYWRRDIAEQLKSGRTAADLVDDLVASRGLPDRLNQDGGGAVALRGRAAATIRAAMRKGIAPLDLADPAFPPVLSAIADPPPVLWLRGERATLARPAVAIVGSRAASPYALTVAGRLAADLSRRGVAVVSGLARGVDSAAHRGALGGAGGTIAVLGSGADIVYPAEHAALAREIVQAGLLVSELVPGTRPRPEFFPLRNRIISGLSRAVVVIEAGEKSGSLITVRCALDQGREVLAVPGSVLNGRNRGGHALIRDGAKIVESADDILEELGPAEVHPGGREAASNEGPADRSDPVMASLAGGESCDLDTISARSGVPIAQLLPRLLALELQGRVARGAGGRFVRFDRSC